MSNFTFQPTGNLTLDLKTAITMSGMKLYQVNDELNRRNGTSLGYQNFSNRLQKGSFRYHEVAQILDVIGFDVVWSKR